ncbi:glycosyltransferase [Adhaeretor mobilis]|uniref:Putative glycosyl transferase n=1 Tax=Adhaeretor mobilis TaxID=1930276 RepID=A0A517MR71_9BACT|nr:glycosyltransferase [Adhaeretor mobilis]QDS97375.1 putative glycosyl transferase [Adhaeretor mobilis]
MDHPATVVLPIHNGERRINALVLEMLDIGETLSCNLHVVIVDDGSTDETFEAACELAVAYPQVRVLHQPVQRGLGAALDRVRRIVNSDRVIVHDGVSPLVVSELVNMLREDRAAKEQNIDPQQEPASQQAPNLQAPTQQARGSRRFAEVTALHQAMERAHQPLTAFRWLQLSDYLSPRRLTTAQVPHLDAASDGANKADLVLK